VDMLKEWGRQLITGLGSGLKTVAPIQAIRKNASRATQAGTSRAAEGSAKWHDKSSATSGAAAGCLSTAAGRSLLRQPSNRVLQVHFRSSPRGQLHRRGQRLSGTRQRGRPPVASVQINAGGLATGGPATTTSAVGESFGHVAVPCNADAQPWPCELMAVEILHHQY
jgi:hypothetical protein